MAADKTNKRRRSERVPARHRMMLIVQGPSGAAILKEIVTTSEISRHGTNIRGRQPLEVGWTGNIIQLSSCRQAPMRVAWHDPSESQAGYFDTGIEILTQEDFWGRSFDDYRGSAEPSDVVIENAGVGSAEFLELIRRADGSPKGQKLLETLWCALVEQLEERRVLNRTEMIHKLRSLGVSLSSD